MHTKPLTKTQQVWLDHINKAIEQNLSMFAYAKQNNLALKSLYYARALLMKKGIVPSISCDHLVPLAVKPTNDPIITTSCRVILPNGVLIECSDIDITT
ncbi:MAG: hypothetical protein GY787_29890 [Alteromonadales bacterium]|nr:hypothetical protein [Alteromonadales bacterium]